MRRVIRTSVAFTHIHFMVQSKWDGVQGYKAKQRSAIQSNQRGIAIFHFCSSEIILSSQLNGGLEWAWAFNGVWGPGYKWRNIESKIDCWMAQRISKLIRWLFNCSGMWRAFESIDACCIQIAVPPFRINVIPRLIFIICYWFCILFVFD